MSSQSNDIIVVSLGDGSSNDLYNDTPVPGDTICCVNLSTDNDNNSSIEKSPPLDIKIIEDFYNLDNQSCIINIQDNN